VRRDFAISHCDHPAVDPHLSADPAADPEIFRRTRRGMPILAFVLELFPAGRGNARAAARILAGNLPDFPLSSMGGQWL
jgi:hypothetical protein